MFCVSSVDVECFGKVEVQDLLEGCVVFRVEKCIFVLCIGVFCVFVLGDDVVIVSYQCGYFIGEECFGVGFELVYLCQFVVVFGVGGWVIVWQVQFVNVYCVGIVNYGCFDLVGLFVVVIVWQVVGYIFKWEL